MMASLALQAPEGPAAVRLSPRQYWLAAPVSLAVHVLLLLALAAPQFEEAQLAGGGASFGLGGNGTAAATGAGTGAGQPQAGQARSDASDWREEQAASPAAALHDGAEPSPPEARPNPASATAGDAAPQRAPVPPLARAANADTASAPAAIQRAASPPQGRTAAPGSEGGEAGGGSPADARGHSRSPAAAPGAGGGQNLAGNGTGSGSARDGAGDAASTNYTGIVTEHIRRNRRSNAVGAGEVILRIAISAKGDVQQINVYHSSGASNFDRQALRMARMAAPYPKPPPGQGAVLVRIKGS